MPPNPVSPAPIEANPLENRLNPRLVMPSVRPTPRFAAPDSPKPPVTYIAEKKSFILRRRPPGMSPPRMPPRSDAWLFRSLNIRIQVRNGDRMDPSRTLTTATRLPSDTTRSWIGTGRDPKRRRSGIMTW